MVPSSPPLPSAKQPRTSQRFRLAYPVVYGGAPFVGEGTLVDLSRTGCAILTDRPVLAGSYIRLGVILPDQPSSLRIDLGKVRWVRQNTFGVEFIRLTAASGEQLDHMTWTHFLHTLRPSTPRDHQAPHR